MSQPLDDGTNFGLATPWFRAYFIGVTSERLVRPIIPKKLKKASGYNNCYNIAETGRFGPESLSILFRFAHNLLSVLDHDSTVAKATCLRLSILHVKRAGALFRFSLIKQSSEDGILYKRKRGDSNSRGTFAPAGFRNRYLQPTQTRFQIFV